MQAVHISTVFLLIDKDCRTPACEGIVGIVRLTVRKLAQDDMHKIEQSFHHVEEYSTLGVFVCFLLITRVSRTVCHKRRFGPNNFVTYMRMPSRRCSTHGRKPYANHRPQAILSEVGDLPRVGAYSQPPKSNR